MEMPSTSDLSRQRFDDLVADLATRRGVVRTQMFGMPSAKIVGGKSFMGLFGDDLVVKLGRADLDEALQVDGADHFDPMGGRPMKEWVLIPAGQHAQWERFAEAAADYVQGLGSK